MYISKTNIQFVYISDSWFLFRCPAALFLPELCHIFLDKSAPNNVLEITARAITYYLDVNIKYAEHIFTIEGALKAICNRLVITDRFSHINLDLAEQCCKVS